MSDLKPGEYIGKNGVIYRWELSNGHYRHMPAHDCEPHMLRPENLRAAGEALTALADEMETERVEVTSTFRIVVRAGDKPYVETKGMMAASLWTRDNSLGADAILAAYRAGRERGRP